MQTSLNRSARIRLSVILIVGALLAVLVHYSPAFFEPNEAANRLSMGGTSTMSVMIQNGFGISYRTEKSVNLEYESTGSTAGINALIDGKYAIAFTHAPLTEDQKQAARAKGGELVQVPVVLCAAVPLYNVKELMDKPPVRFSGDVLAEIFLGSITKWNDPKLATLNPGVALPDLPITVVHRKDSSGTTFVFADYLQGTSEAWRTKMSPAESTMKWPVGVGIERNLGVRQHIEKTNGAIGYVDLVFASNGDVRYGAVENKDKNAFIHVEPKHITAAANGVASSVGEDFAFSLTNRPGAEAYPICGAVWAVCYRNQASAKQPHVADFLRWATHEGQKTTAKLAYASLPADLIPRVEQQLALIQPGK